MTNLKLRHSTRYLNKRLTRIIEIERLVGKRGESKTIKATREVAIRSGIEEKFAVRQFSVSDRNGCRFYVGARKETKQ